VADLRENGLMIGKSMLGVVLIDQFELADNLAKRADALLQVPVGADQAIDDLAIAEGAAVDVASDEDDSEADENVFHDASEYNNIMLSLRMEEFITWFETKMDGKYAMKMESLKRSLMFFYNLADQVVFLYHAMRQKVEKYSDKEEYKDIVGLLNRSLIIIAKITDRIPVCLDSHFCEKFIKAFDFNINLLCTYYHSLSHFEQLSNSLPTQRRTPFPRRTRSWRESTRCTPSTSRSKIFTSTTWRSSKLSPSSPSTSASSPIRSTPSPASSKLEDRRGITSQTTLKCRPSSSMKDCLRKRKL
jgi:hypothetical protein